MPDCASLKGSGRIGIHRRLRPTAHLLALLGAVASLIASGSPALAHGSDTRLELSAQRVPPGATVSVRGVGFAADDEISIELFGGGGLFPLATLVAGPEGGFDTPVAVPAAAAQGDYRVVATGTDGHPVITSMVVEGQPLVEDDHDHGEDVIVVVTPAPAAPGSEPPTTTGPRASAPGSTEAIPLVAAVAALLVAALLVVAYMSRRPA